MNKDTGENAETEFDASYYELDRPLPKAKKIKKAMRLMKDELDGKIIAKFLGLRAKKYSYLIDTSSEDKKPKGTKKCVIKRKRSFENYKNCFEANGVDNKINYLEKSKTDIESIKKTRKNF